FLLLYVPDPGRSIDDARQAYMAQDLASFDKYVDVQSVLDSGIDQFVDFYIQNHHVDHPTIYKMLIDGGKRVYLPQLSQSVEQLVVTGNIQSLPSWVTDNATMSQVTSSISKVLHDLARSQLVYLGVRTVAISGKTAGLDIEVGQRSGGSPVLVSLRMQRVGFHWRITAIDNIPSVITQLGIQIP
ncbi:MAG: hypothetical protein ABSH28_15215, partial [Acidobacteriota bacterium]